MPRDTGGPLKANSWAASGPSLALLGRPQEGQQSDLSRTSQSCQFSFSEPFESILLRQGKIQVSSTRPLSTGLCLLSFEPHSPISPRGDLSLSLCLWIQKHPMCFFMPFYLCTKDTSCPEYTFPALSPSPNPVCTSKVNQMFIHSFFLSTYYVPSIVLGVGGSGLEHCLKPRQEELVTWP